MKHYLGGGGGGVRSDLGCRTTSEEPRSINRIQFFSMCLRSQDTYRSS